MTVESVTVFNYMVCSAETHLLRYNDGLFRLVGCTRWRMGLMHNDGSFRLVGCTGGRVTAVTALLKGRIYRLPGTSVFFLGQCVEDVGHCFRCVRSIVCRAGMGLSHHDDGSLLLGGLLVVFGWILGGCTVGIY